MPFQRKKIIITKLANKKKLQPFQKIITKQSICRYTWAWRWKPAATKAKEAGDRSNSN